VRVLLQWMIMLLMLGFVGWILLKMAVFSKRDEAMTWLLIVGAPVALTALVAGFVYAAGGSRRGGRHGGAQDSVV
jgi:hypothetical protein